MSARWPGKAAAPLEKSFGIVTVGDLLRHYPRRLVERGELTDLAALQEDEEVTVWPRSSRRPQDGLSGPRVGQPAGRDGHRRRRRQLSWCSSAGPGSTGCGTGRSAVGPVRRDVGSYRGRRQLVHPESRMLDEADPGADGRRGRAGRLGRRPRRDLPGEQGHAHVDDLGRIAPGAGRPRPGARSHAGGVRREHGLLDLDTALRADAPARVARPVASGQAATGLGRGARRCSSRWPAAPRRHRANPAIARPPRAVGRWPTRSRPGCRSR